jgi:Helix-turn-helix domain
MNDFVRRKENWLRAVAADKRLHEWAPLAIAVAIASYLNSKSGEAWPGIERLAEELQADRRSCQRALDRLVAAGWLSRTLGGGRRKTNRYRLNSGLCAAVSRSRNSGPRHQNSGPHDQKTAGYHPPEPKNEPHNNRRRTTAGSKRYFAGAQRGRTHALAQLFPERWAFGDEEAQVAQRSPARWGLERARQEFHKFRRWHLNRNNRSGDWCASWVNWCRKGCEIEERDASRAVGKKDKVAAAVAGTSRWYQRQKAAAAALLVEGEREGTNGEDDQ